MNRSEIASLLTRMDVTYPRAQLADVELRMRVEEWFDSRVAAFDWNDVGREAWRWWKDQHDRPPTPHQFADVCNAGLRRRALDNLPIEPPLTDEQRKQNIEFVRLARESIRNHPTEDAS